MRFLKFSELEDFTKALIKVYSCVVALSIVAGLIVSWLSGVNVGLPIIIVSTSMFVILIVFLYFIDCFMHVE